MLSLIVSSSSKILLAKFQKNVAETIGSLAYELIEIENANGRVGICNAYNTGANKAQYPYLCFIHEDVAFKTQDWGKILAGHLQPEHVGIIGIAGSIYKARMVSGWWQRFRNAQDLERSNIIQHYKYSDQKVMKHFTNPDNEKLSEVVVLDGVLLAMKRQTWEKYHFDEKLLTGFHGYDLDISLTIGQMLKNYVVYDIELEHFSEGRTDMTWFYHILKVHYKFRKTLPRTHLTQQKRLYPERHDWHTVNLYGQKMIGDNVPFKTFSKNIYQLVKLVDIKTFTPFSFIKGILTTVYGLLMRSIKHKRQK